MSPAAALPPLRGIRVADFSRVIAGPLCAMTLADLGADVVKIENPEGGDDTRGYRPPDYKGLSPAFVCYNRNKRSIALDLNKAEDLAKAKALTERADLVIENFRTGLMEKFGLGYDDLAPANRSEEHTSELQSLMRNSYDVFCLKKKHQTQTKR